MDWANIVNTIGTIILAWFTYNQYTKHKTTDYKIEKLKNEDKVRNRRRSDNAMKVYGALWNVLYELKADRVYIVQPHPLGNEEMLTICFEVKKKGAEPMKPQIQNMKISEVAKFAECLEEQLFLYITNIEEQIPDRYAQAIFGSLGTKCALLKRLSDNRHDWVGSIICEFMDDIPVSEADARHILHSAATSIQFILPEVEGN